MTSNPDPWQPVRDMFASISAPFVLDGALSGLRPFSRGEGGKPTRDQLRAWSKAVLADYDRRGRDIAEHKRRRDEVSVELDAVRAQRDDALEAYRAADEDRTRRARERDQALAGMETDALAYAGLRTVYEEVEGERNRYAHENRRLRAELAEARAQRDVWRRQAVEVGDECDGLRDECDGLREQIAVTHGQRSRAELREWVCVARHHHPGPHPRNEGCRVAPIPEGVATSRGYGDK